MVVEHLLINCFYVEVAELHVLRNSIILELIFPFIKFFDNFLLVVGTHNKFLGTKNFQSMVLGICFMSTCTCSATNESFHDANFGLAILM